MSGIAFDPEILQDFLTESGELLDALEGDLVALEQDAQNPDLVNKVFRALHTIKGSASFLALTNLVSIAHAAESALNAARNGSISINRPMMDLLLQAVDVIKRQMGQLRAGKPLETPPAAAVAALTELGEGKQAGAASKSPAPATPAAPACPAAGEATAPSTDGKRPLVVPANRLDLLEFFVADLSETLKNLEEQLGKFQTPSARSAAAPALAECTDNLARVADFFEYPEMVSVVRGIGRFALAATAGMNAAALEQALVRSRALAQVLREQAEGIQSKHLLALTCENVLNELNSISTSNSAAGVNLFNPSASPEQVLRGAPAGASPNSGSGASDAPSNAAAKEPEAATTPAPREGEAEGPAKRSTQAAASGDQTIRVEVERLETLMNLVGELVLQKNRIAAVVRNLDVAKVGHDTKEVMMMSAGGLDRVTADIQVAVMRTRMQPLDKLFGKYPRLIRDLARKTSKDIELVIEGGDTEVDKSVLEELGDPLVHLMRNSADHGVETPDERVKAGKSPTARITLSASHEGSHVRVQVRDDGRGLNREKIIKKAVERGLVKAEATAALPDREVFQFIFLPGFSTADQVSDLSGRGVGMDVVRTNIEKIKGTVELDSTTGKGTTVTILIPLTVAIMPAMMVAVASEIYAVPLTSIVEIVKPDADVLGSIGQHPVMRLRDGVLPLVGAKDLFDVPADKVEPAPFAVVLSQNDKRVGLMVSRLIGQQEIVVKPLDGIGIDISQGKRAVSGATVRDDGGVSLIVDVAELIRMAESARVLGAA
ncbi:MAG: chemotaxis protein CheA [Planctomycetota bacterium]|nr:chemotaxis protein CheA [Planctomycetota bacterium]